MNSLTESLKITNVEVLTETGVRLATDMMLLIDDETFHVLYNSLLGHASVNHLHLHTIFWPYDSDLINRVSFLFTERILEPFDQASTHIFDTQKKNITQVLLKKIVLLWLC